MARSAVVEASEQLKRALDQIATLPQTPVLRRQQLKLQIALANALMQIKGYAAPEPKVAFEQARLFMERAEALGEAPEDPLLLFSFLWGVWSGNYVKFNGEAIKSLASQFMALAERQGTTTPLMVGHRLIGMSALHTGDIDGSRQHFDRAIALYDPAEHRALAPRFGQDIRVATLCFRAKALWLLGYPALALADIESALKDAREIDHGPSLMYALFLAAKLNIYCGILRRSQQARRRNRYLRNPKGRRVLEGARDAFSRRGIGVSWQCLGRSSEDRLRDQRLPINGIDCVLA